MMINEAKIKEEILNCLNESRTDKAVRNGPINESSKKIKFEGYVFGGGKLAVKKGDESDWPGDEETVRDFLKSGFDDVYVVIPNTLKNLSEEDANNIRNLVSGGWEIEESDLSYDPAFMICCIVTSRRDINAAVANAGKWIDILYKYCKDNSIDLENWGDTKDDYTLLLHGEA